MKIPAASADSGATATRPVQPTTVSAMAEAISLLRSIFIMGDVDCAIYTMKGTKYEER